MIKERILKFVEVEPDTRVKSSWS